MLLAALFLALWLLPSPQDPYAELRLRLVEEINRDRRAAGLAAVRFSEELSAAADAHCREMLREGYSSHWNRAGWPAYLRYAQAGIRMSTAENIWSVWRSAEMGGADAVWREMLDGHRSFLAEKPPRDGHRRAVLDPNHTHAGIGVARDGHTLRMIEVFGAQHAELAPLPLRAGVRDALRVRGRVPPRLELVGVAVYYEPLPRPMTREELQATLDYSLPDEEQMLRPVLDRGVYFDGAKGAVEVEPGGRFSAPLLFGRGRPGVYTVGVWVRPSASRRTGAPGGKAFLGALTSLRVE
jgi:hypothetical protein